MAPLEKAGFRTSETEQAEGHKTLEYTESILVQVFRAGYMLCRHDCPVHVQP